MELDHPTPRGTHVARHDQGRRRRRRRLDRDRLAGAERPGWSHRHGPDPAGHVVIKDHGSKRGRITLARVIGATSPVKCTIDRIARCPIAIVAAHDHVTMTVAVRARRRGRFVDSSHVSSSVPDPHPANDRDKATIRIRRANPA